MNSVLKTVHTQSMPRWAWHAYNRPKEQETTCIRRVYDFSYSQLQDGLASPTIIYEIYTHVHVRISHVYNLHIRRVYTIQDV